MPKPKRPNLNVLLRKWQKRLRLQNWDITVEYVPLSVMRMDDQTVAGMCTPQPQHLTAEIVILDPTEFPEDLPPAYKNVELTFVHELLHVVFCGAFDHLDDHPALGNVQEQIVETVAKALMEV